MDHREHSVNFDMYNSWDMWHLVPSSRPTPPVPEMRTNYVTVPGRSGSLDLSTALTGNPIYEDRDFDIDFIVLDQEMNWIDIYHDVVDKLHGKQMEIRLLDEPGWYYYGRVTVSEFTSNSDYSSININIHAEPYKYSDSINEDIIRLYPADMTNITTAGSLYKQISIVMGYPMEETASIKNANQVLTNGSILLTRNSFVRNKTDVVYEPSFNLFTTRQAFPRYSIELWNNYNTFGVTPIEDGYLTSDGAYKKGILYANPSGTSNNITTIRINKVFVDSWDPEDYMEIKMRWHERSI